VSRHDIPKEKKIIGNRWIFTRKDDGRFCAHCVAKGYSQIPGKYIQENHAPVLHDTTIHLIIAMSVLYQSDSCQFDVETALLFGELEETIHMEFPIGYERYLIEMQNRMRNKKIKMDFETICLLLKKALYGLWFSVCCTKIVQEDYRCPFQDWFQTN
jgi:Reverse transcriptase (RNA-dependent DNA polymerase)